MSKTFRNASHAANELQDIRNDLAGGLNDSGTLQARVDAVGMWAAQQKNSRSISKILDEANILSDKLAGGTGHHGTRISIVGV